MLGDFLFYEEDATKKEKSNYINLKVEIRGLLKEKFNRELLSEILLDLYKDVSGETLQRLFKLYKDLGLHLDAFKKLRSWRWEVVSSGILELTQMQVMEAYGFATKFINDKRGVIRKQAEIATVTLKPEGISYFLDTTQYRISEWQQLKLLDVIRNIDDFQPPQFKLWLTSTNKDVVLFSLRLIKYYKQNDANASITQLVKHKNNQVKTEAIQCIKEFCIFEALDTLKNVFWKCSLDIQLLILDAIADLGKEDEIGFLQHVEKKSKAFVVKSKAISAINAIAPETIMPTEGMDEKLKNESPEVPFVEVEEEIIYEIQNQDNNELSPFEGIDKERILGFEVESEEISDLPAKIVMDDIIEEFLESGDTLLDKGDSIELEFLPLIVEDISQSDSKIGLSEIGNEVPETKEEEIDNKEVSNLNVTYEEITAEPSSNEIVENMENISDNPQPEDKPLKLEFIPLVVANEVENDREDFTEPTLLDCLDYLPHESVFKQLFFERENHNKILLLNTIQDIGSKHEIELLKEIVNTEENMPIKERALEILNDISGKKHHYIKAEARLIDNDELKSGSVFKRLFYAGDLDSKLMLLDEIAAWGDDKELTFLNTLIEHPIQEIRERALHAKEKLQNRLFPEEKINVGYQENDQGKRGEEHVEANVIETEPKLNFVMDKELGSPQQKHKIIQDSTNNSGELMPLEFCFLLDDLEIKPPKTDTVLDVDFEFTKGFSGNQVNDNYNQRALISTEEQKEQDSFLKQWLSFPAKILNKFNG